MYITIHTAINISYELYKKKKSWSSYFFRKTGISSWCLSYYKDFYELLHI